MKNFNRLISLLLVCFLAAGIVGCERTRTVSGYYTGDEYTDEQNGNGAEEGENDNGKTSDGSTVSGKNTSSKGTTSKSGNKNARSGDIWQIYRDVKPGASKSVLDGLNFKGKTLRMLVHQSNFTDLLEKQIQDFAKKYNCTIKIDNLNFEDNLSAMATSLSAGKPYDIVLCHNAFFPQVAVANLCQPLEAVISKADISESYGKQGLSWNMMMNSATWANHIYYTIDNKFCYMPVVYYNKLLIDDFGLEDPLDLYKKGEWTYDKLLEYGKIVKNANQGVSFFDSTLVPGANNDFYKIDESGKITWLGANSALANDYILKRKYQEVSSLSGSTALVDNMISGKVICARMEAEKLVEFAKTLKDSAALGKNLDNLGVAPMPKRNDYYATHAPIGYAACRGTDPTAAVALGVYLSNMAPSWATDKIPALKANQKLFEGLYNKMNKKLNSYYFLTSSGKRIETEIYSMYTEIDNGGDIMKLLESYAPTVKSILEYNLEKQ